ncbi:MAG TPA: DinB family protein [Gemmatimonadales bacterium]|nr:DinB family protein [Gemmatimonadales bacterium]
MTNDQELRRQLVRLLDWEDAHIGLEAAAADLPPSLRGVRPAGLPHSPWELLEHIRLAQRDILEFCQHPDYTAKRWPEDYWPATPGPPVTEAWDESVAATVHDREALQALALDSAIDLFTVIPHGSGQTYLRELVLIADHTAYHVGQLVLARRALGSWNPS